MLKSKGFSKELEAFCAEYEEEVQEMLVLTAEHVGGACSYVEGIWRPSAEFLASADLVYHIPRQMPQAEGKKERAGVCRAHGK